MTTTQSEPLAIDGGKKALAEMTGKPQPKVGTEEFIALAERWGYSTAAVARIRAAISDADLPAGGASLARYFGPPKTKGDEFEAAARVKFGCKFARCTSSGTGALHAAMAAVGVGPGTEVICPAMGFMATSAAVAVAGGVPIFCDVDESLQLDPRKIEGCITPRTVAVAPTHHWGWVCDMDPIVAVARKHNLKVIEDCAQSPGARYKGRYVGTIGDLGCFSISAYKIIGGGEGGMVTTNDERLFERASQLIECGGLWRPNRFAPPRYEGELFVGTNYRASELESTVNVVQLAKLDGVVARFQQVNRAITSRLRRFQEIRPQRVNDPQGQIGYLLRFFPATMELAARIVEALRAEGVSCGHRGPKAGPDWHVASNMFPVILQTAPTGQTPFNDPRYVSRGGKVVYDPKAWPVAHDLYNRAVSVGLEQWWSAEDPAALAHALNKVLGAYCTEIPGEIGWH